MLVFAESQVPKLISREIIFVEFQRVWSQSTKVTDGQTDRQTTYHGNTALRYASRGKKWQRRDLRLDPSRPYLLIVCQPKQDNGILERLSVSILLLGWVGCES